MTSHLEFLGWSHSTGWSLLLIGCVVLAVSLIVMLYRYERRLVPPQVGTLLLALRLGVIAFVFLALLEPVVSWKRDERRSGRIVVAVDLSGSMDTADTHASAGEKLRWARAVGMIGNAAVDARLDRWQKALDDGQEPAWLDPEEPATGEAATQLASSRKSNLDAILAEAGQLSRKELARRLLLQSPRPLLPELENLAVVQVVGFAGRGTSIDAAGLPPLLDKPPESLQAQRSDLTQALLPAVADSESSAVLGVVLFSDGRDNAGMNPLPLAQRMHEMRVPLFPVMLGSRHRPKDLAIATLDYPPSVFKDDKPLLKAAVRLSGFEGREVEVILECEGAEPVRRTVASLEPTATVEFPLEDLDLGRHQFTLRMDVQEGETRNDNNSKSFAISVVDDKVRVALLEGEARWEFRFIDNALKRDTRVEIESVLFQQPYLGILPDTFFPRQWRLPPADAETAQSPLARTDLLVLGDVAPGALPPGAWERIEKFVAESGGTLVLTAGKRHFPLAHPSPIVERLLPVTNLRPLEVRGDRAKAPPTERGFRLRLTPEGEAEPVLQFDADPERNRAIWRRLPGHLWGLVGEAKPGATVFATAEGVGPENPLQAERESALLVHQHYGLGQVLWIGIDSTWRWRHRVGDRYHHRFWGQLGRWAANTKAAVGNEFVMFGPERTDIEVGEDAVIRARWTQAALQQAPDVKARAVIYREDEKSDLPFSTIDLVPEENRPLLYEGRAIALPAGSYRVKLEADGVALGDVPIEAPLYVQEPATPELSDLSANEELLKQLAETTGGRLLRPDEVGSIPELIKPTEQTTSHREELLLWNHGFMLLIFFALLTAEWVTRKLNGLP